MDGLIQEYSKLTNQSSKKHKNSAGDKMDKLIQEYSKLTNLENKLKELLEEEKKRVKYELETIIDASDEIVVDNHIKDKQKINNKTRVNKKYLDKIIRECNGVVFIVDKTGIIKETNKKMESALGYRKEDLKGMEMNSIFAEADTLAGATKKTIDILQWMPLIYESKKHDPAPAETIFIDKQKNAIPFQLKATVLKDSNDQLMGVVVLLIDIEKRKKVEVEIVKAKEHVEKLLETTKGIEIIERLKEELQESKRYTDNIFESSADGIIIADPYAYIKSVNKAIVKLLDYQPHELIGKHMAELCPTWLEDSEFQTSYGEKISCAKVSEINIKAAAAVNECHEAYVDFFLMRRDGILIPAWTSYYLLHNKEGVKLEAVIVVRDLTEKKLDEVKLKNSYRKLEEYSRILEEKVAERTAELNKALIDTAQARDRIDGIIKSVAEGLVVTDIYNRVVLMNRPAEDLLGVRLSEVIDQPIESAIKDKMIRDRIMTTLEMKKTGYEFDFELPGNDPKHPRIMRARTSIMYDTEGRQTGIVTIIHDVTHEREVDRMKTEFISTAAHELRTPLTSIQGFSEIILTRDDLSEQDKKKFLHYISKQSTSLTNIVSDLLDIARIEGERGFAFNKVPCNIDGILNQVVPYFQEQTQKHHFEIVFPETPVELLVDKQKMEQVFKNLISNAVKYSPEGGIICVSVWVTADSFEVSVEDQGIGMTPEQVEKMFDKFYRADASNTAIEGTGLGMTIVKYIVEGHGGKIWVESESGKGTTVRFTIPI